jgi:ribosomal protein L37AE/L43A
MHVEDLKQVQAALGIRYQLADGTHYQDICPACRRKNVALTQDGLWKSSVLDTRGQ